MPEILAALLKVVKAMASSMSKSFASVAKEAAHLDFSSAESIQDAIKQLSNHNSGQSSISRGNIYTNEQKNASYSVKNDEGLQHHFFEGDHLKANFPKARAEQEKPQENSKSFHNSSSDAAPELRRKDRANQEKPQVNNKPADGLLPKTTPEVEQKDRAINTAGDIYRKYIGPQREEFQQSVKGLKRELYDWGDDGDEWWRHAIGATAETLLDVADFSEDTVFAPTRALKLGEGTGKFSVDGDIEGIIEDIDIVSDIVPSGKNIKRGAKAGRKAVKHLARKPRKKGRGRRREKKKFEPDKRAFDNLTKAEKVAARRLFGKKLTHPNTKILGKIWKRVTHAEDVRNLTKGNSRKLFDNQRSRFWRSVYNDPKAKKLIESMGARFDKKGNAPYLLTRSGKKVRITIDHMTERQSNYRKTLDPSNLQLTTYRENTVLLRLLHFYDPGFFK